MSSPRKRTTTNHSQLAFQWADAAAGGPSDSVPSFGACPPSPPECASVSNMDTVPEADSVVAAPHVGYEPSHPWHYYRLGDHAAPIPLESIPPSLNAGEDLAARMPKSPIKRAVFLKDMLDAEHCALDEAQRRYQDIAERGAEALSRYDREIAHGGNDELAVASALALTYNHISRALGWVAWLQRQASPQPCSR